MERKPEETTNQFINMNVFPLALAIGHKGTFLQHLLEFRSVYPIIQNYESRIERAFDIPDQPYDASLYPGRNDSPAYRIPMDLFTGTAIPGHPRKRKTVEPAARGEAPSLERWSASDLSELD